MKPAVNSIEERLNRLFRIFLIFCGMISVAVGLFAKLIGLSSDPWFGKNRVICLVAGLMLLGVGFLCRNIKWLLPLVCVILTYTLFEVVFTSLYMTHSLGFVVPVYAFEDIGKTVQFDAIRGYKLTQTPSLYARITGGELEYVSILKGNNQGFPDRDDFSPGRDPSFRKRFAVFGDSFTAGATIRRNWPDYVEDATKAHGCPVQMLNFAVDGGGLANWWSILVRLIEPEKYELDGLIFAVWNDDLRRTFTMMDQRDRRLYAVGRTSSWDPKAFPSTLEQAKPNLTPLRKTAYIMSAEEFQNFMQEKSSVLKEPLRPYFALRVSDLFTQKQFQRNRPPVRKEILPGAKPLVEDIRRSIRALNVPVMVVYLPTKDGLLENKGNVDVPQDVRQFASMLDATLINGTIPFAKANSKQIRKMWHHYDGHWAQEGSNCFGDFFAKEVLSWPSTAGDSQKQQHSFDAPALRR
jgi:hypothetical protein